jgi:uncharacterized protein YjiK
MRFIYIFLIYIVGCGCAASCQAQSSLKFTKKFKLKIAEPSDICLSASKSSLFIVSDQGGIYETDLKGTIIRSRIGGLDDCEGVAIRGKSEILVVEERKQTIQIVNANDFTIKSRINIPFKGRANSAFESITFNGTNWLLFTEKHPCLLFIFSDNLTLIEKKNVIVPADVSAATWNNGRLWLLSDENSEIYLMKPSLTEIDQRFQINVNSAEGLTFLDDGTLLIVSDKNETLYYFNSPLLQVQGN